MATTTARVAGEVLRKILVVSFLAGLAPAMCAWGQARPPAGKAEISPSFAERAREAVLGELQRLQLRVDEFRVETVGAPVFLPEHTRLHRPLSTKRSDSATVVGQVVDVTAAPTATPQPPPLPRLPKVIVLVAAYSRGRLYRSFQVYFRSEVPLVLSLDLQNTPAVAHSQLPLEEKEWRQVASELTPFYATLLNITRGPERFHPYLPETMKNYGCSTSWGILCVDSHADLAIGLSEEELRRLTSLWLDFMAHSIWYRFEGLELPEVPRDEPDSPIDAGYLRKGSEWLAQTVGRMKEELKTRGVLAGAHLATSSVYLRRLVGEGLLAKESNIPHQVKGLRRDAALYYARLYGMQWAVHLHFARVNGRLRLVEMELD